MTRVWCNIVYSVAQDWAAAEAGELDHRPALQGLGARGAQLSPSKCDRHTAALKLPGGAALVLTLLSNTV